MVKHNGNTDLFISWLNDAYAMEEAQVSVLKHHAKDAGKHGSPLQSRLEQHLRETERQAELIRSCVERLGSSTSSAKAGMSKLFGSMKATSTGMAKDELVKNQLSDIAAEHFEIACYKSLIAAAEDVGDVETARVCEQILREEEEMAEFLEDTLPQTTRSVMHEHAGAKG